MSKSSLSPVEIERASEQIRQERETFDQQKSHADRWFRLRLTMGYASVALLGAVIAIAAYVLLHPSVFSLQVQSAAGAALFVDVLGLLAGVWRISLNPELIGKLSPVTDSRLLSSKNGKKRRTSLKDEKAVALPSGGRSSASGAGSAQLTTKP